MQFTDLLTTIGSWPQVEFFFLFMSDPKPKHSGREGICVGVPGPALLPRHAGLGREEEGGGLPAQVCHTTPEIPQ